MQQLPTPSRDVTYYCAPVDNAGTYTCVPMLNAAPAHRPVSGAGLVASEKGAVGNVPGGDYELRTEQGLPVLYRTSAPSKGHIGPAPRKTFDTEVMYPDENLYGMRTIRQ